MLKETTPFDMYATGVVDLQSAKPTKVGGERYSLRRMLGRGGMGVVWLAYDERLQCEVALKFLPPQIRFDAAAVDDLRRETARSQKLSHPNIIRIHDLYEPEGEDAFISMEYVDGSNLNTLRAQRPERVLSWQFLEPLVGQFCEALEYAHGEGIIHRDLKPANLMVNQAGNLKLADFGIARAVTDTMSRSSVAQTSGTLIYMSPQQLDGGFPKVTDDIYGIGATLYELLTSKPPFFTGDLLNQVRNVPATPLQQRLDEMQLANKIPGHIEDLLMACLSKVPAQRPQTAREISEWLSLGRRPAGAGSGRSKREGIIKPILSLIRKRKLWYSGAATAAIAAGVYWAVMGRSDNKVSARDVGHARPQSSVGSPKSTPVRGDTKAKPPVSAPARPPTALQLARQGNIHVSERSYNQVVQMLSSRSTIDSRPQQWRIIYYDPKARYRSVEVRFENGKMARIHEPARILEYLTPQAQKPVDIEKLKVDSNDALRIALSLPAMKDLIPQSVEFELARGYGGLAVWKVQLFGMTKSESAREVALGYAIILADDGKVLKETFSRKQDSK